ncbi:uncharacterized protein LOC131951759 [Physella acuta]|uniref:uncharacterized protein LOC131951759 n=1 Tax=Physella acuta TaxID=109671 RepID=UPI0027DDCCF2|nr:uncharacterized protein LOC131951759 [Physella acuta]
MAPQGPQRSDDDDESEKVSTPTRALYKLKEIKGAVPEVFDSNQILLLHTSKMFKLVLVLSIGYIAAGLEQVDDCDALEKCMDPKSYVTPANVETLYGKNNSEALRRNGNKFYTCFYTSVYKCSDPVRNNYLKGQLKLVTFLTKSKKDIEDLSKCKDKDKIKWAIAFINYHFWRSLKSASYNVITLRRNIKVEMDRELCEKLSDLSFDFYIVLTKLCPKNSAEMLSWYWEYYQLVNFEVYSWCDTSYIGIQLPARNLSDLVRHPRVEPPDINSRKAIKSFGRYYLPLDLTNGHTN